MSKQTHKQLADALLHARKLVAARDVVLDRAALRYYDETLCECCPEIAKQIDSATVRGFFARATLAKAKGGLRHE